MSGMKNNLFVLPDRSVDSSFVSVTDRFLMELGPLSHGQVSKDLEMKYENLVKGIKHIQIKVNSTADLLHPSSSFVGLASRGV